MVANNRKHRPLQLKGWSFVVPASQTVAKHQANIIPMYLWLCTSKRTVYLRYVIYSHKNTCAHFIDHPWDVEPTTIWCCPTDCDDDKTLSQHRFNVLCVSADNPFCISDIIVDNGQPVAHHMFALEAFWRVAHVTMITSAHIVLLQWRR